MSFGFTRILKPSISMFAPEWWWQGVWDSFPFLASDLSMHRRTQIWFFNQFMCTRTCACSSNLNYAHKMHWKLSLCIKMSKRTPNNPKNWHNTPIVLCWHEKKIESNKRQWISFRPQRWDVPYRKPSCLLWEALDCEKHIPKPAPNGTKNLPRHVDAATW